MSPNGFSRHFQNGDNQTDVGRNEPNLHRSDARRQSKASREWFVLPDKETMVPLGAILLIRSETFWVFLGRREKTWGLGVGCVKKW